jgi:RNA polymerase sigma-70 factor (ECF subfamily)
MNSVATTYAHSMERSVLVGEATPAGSRLVPAPDDRSVVDRLIRGDELAFDELVTKYHGPLVRMAMGYVADSDVAEEVVQDTWMGVIESLSRFEGRSSLRTWIFGILIHKAKDRGVREKRHITFSAFDSLDDENDEAVDPARFHQSGEWAGHWAFRPQPWDEQTPEKLLASRQATDCMQQAIADLPPMLREVLILRDVGGAESRDVCELLNITETNLYVRLHRVRERVRGAIELYLEEGADRPSARTAGLDRRKEWRQ